MFRQDEMIEIEWFKHSFNCNSSTAKCVNELNWHSVLRQRQTQIDRVRPRNEPADLIAYPIQADLITH